MEQALQAYIQEILISREYREYAEIRDKVKQFPELKEQIDEFRIKNFEMQTDEETAFEKIEEFEKEYGDFLEIPLVSEFLAAELAFCRMMQRNNEVIMNAIPFE